ncbi:MAG: excinuclease ABC subunit C, partial [Pedobacter sp.]
MSAFDHRKALTEIPHKPGVYQFWDNEEKLMYIGKAKDLRNRVGSYFNSEHNNQFNGKTKVLVSKIRKITFTLVDTEIDAWLLENSLIKKHQPKFNINLKDDKTYPWIIIKKESYPRIFWTRKVIKDGSTYLGPYGSIGMMHTILDLIKETYPLRSCNLPLTEKNILAGKFKVCLEYQIGNCKGPCQAYQSEEDYDKNIREIKEILNGKIGNVIREVKQVIRNASESLNFELAHQYQRKLGVLEKYQSKSTIVNSAINNVDVVSIASDERYAFVNYLKIANGSIIQTQTIEIKKQLDESDEELLTLALTEFRTKFNSTSREVIVPFNIPLKDELLKFTVPKLG